MINLYDSKTTNFNNNGLVVLSDAISCKIEEELNGSFECTLEYPIDERGKWKELLEGNIIKADGQLFRIYYKTKTLKDIKIVARHISYDLIDNMLEDVRPTNLSGAGAMEWILENTQYSHPFTSISDVQTIATKYFVRKNPIEAIMGDDGIITNWGGELVRDNFTIELLGARGLNRGVLITYGKNVQGIEESLDMDGLCTRVMPKGNNELLLPEKYIDSEFINNYPFPKIKVVEFSNIGIDETNGITEAMAIVLLRSAGKNHFTTSKCDIPQFNYKIDFLELSKTEEYKKFAVLERIYLGDIVTIKHSKLDIDLQAKVIKTTKNILTNRLDKVELGSFKPNIANTIGNVTRTVNAGIVQVTSAYQKAIDNATALITGSQGGNVVIRQNEDGKPYEILIMDTADVMTAVNVWRWNLGGFGHSSTGVNGPFDTAITQDGSIVGKFITALEINGEQIIAGIIQSKTGNWKLNLDGESFNLGNKLVFENNQLSINLSSGKTLDEKMAEFEATNIGGRNLLFNSSALLGTMGWVGGIVATNIYNKISFLINNTSTTAENTKGSTVFRVEPNTKYRVSCYLLQSGNCLGIDVFFLGSKTIKTGIGGDFDYATNLISGKVPEDWKKYEFEFTTKSDEVCGYIRLDNNGVISSGTAEARFTEIKVEKGDKVTAWTPSFEDTQTQIDGAIQRISSAELKITDAAIVGTVTNSQTYINNLNEKITAEQSSTIAQTAENVRIGFNKIADYFSFSTGGMRCNHVDGSYTVISSQGLTRYVSTTGQSYHYLKFSGSISKVWSGSTYRVYLPAEFKGKNYMLDWWAGNTFPKNPTDVVFSSNVNLISEDKNAASFVVEASLMVRDPATEGAPAWRGEMNILYTVIY